MEVQKRRKRGRPKGTTKEVIIARGPRLTKWEPSVWKPLHELAVILHLKGYKQVDIAKTLETTPQHVHNILSCKQGQEKIELYNKTVRERASEELGGKLGRIGAKFLERIEKVAYSDELFEKAPLPVIDRGMKFLQAIGVVDKENTKNGDSTFNGPAFFMGDEIAERFISGLEKSNKAKNLHEGNVELIVDKRRDVSDVKRELTEEQKRLIKE